MAKVLVVEDDPMAASHMKQSLSQEGHLVEHAGSGEDALQLCTNFEFDLIMLDWSLPDITGIEVLREYRKRGGNAWVIFCTSHGDLDHKERGLDTGADDYMVKPIESRELLARVRRALRRTEGQFHEELKIDGLTLDPATRTAKVGELSVRLMPKECSLLEYLMRNPNKWASTKKLLAAVWPSDTGVTEGAVRTSMRNLRQKLEIVGKSDLVKTVLKSGYVIQTTEQAPEAQS